MDNIQQLHRSRGSRRAFYRVFLLVISSLTILRPAAADQTVGTQQLHGHVPVMVARLSSAAPLLTATNLQLAIGLPLRNAEGLTNLLRQLYDPSSTNYHHYLTSAQFVERFGPTEQEYQAVIAFAESQGLKVTATHPNRVLLDVNGPVAKVEKALHVTMRVYPHPNGKRTFYAPDREPSLDLTVPVLHIGGLDNYAPPQPHLQVAPLNLVPNIVQPNAGSGPGGSYRGGDFRAAYAPDTTLTGTGQSVGLLQFDGYSAGDVTYYETQAGLPSVTLQNVLIDGASGSPSGSGGEVEVSLDIEMAVSMAPGLSKVIVYMAPNPSPWEDILNRMATDNLAKQLSSSWYAPGGLANPSADQIYQQMAAQGQSFFNASGDYDAYTGLISFPGDTPYLTQVGGTTLTTTGPGGSLVSETVWNRGNGIGSGGGISTQYPIPGWQTNINMVPIQGSTIQRNIPDVALTAEGIYVRANGQNYTVGGTSCAAPLWAGFAALINQQAVATGHAPIGFVNPAIYALGSSPNYTTCFHDTTTGNNTSSSSPTKFYAVTGYDLCTGWGTPAGQNLINALASPEPLVITPPTGFASIGGAGGPFSVASQVFTLTNAGTNSLSWTLVNTSLWLNASPSGGTLASNGPATIVTVNLNTTASNLPVGTYSGTIRFTNLSDTIGQGRQFTLTVLSPPIIITQPTNQGVLEGASAAFIVQAARGVPLAYQWQINGTNLTDGGGISGSTTTNLTITNVTVANIGNYRVIVTNYAGVAISSNAALTITPSPPVIVGLSTNQTVYVGANVQFAVAVLGNDPLSYQWSVNATNIAGATNATLSLTNVQLFQAGNYTVLVTNLYGATNSAAAVLTVNPIPPCAPVGAGLVSWWAAEGNANDSIGANNGTLVGGMGFVPGKVGQAFSFDGTSGYVSIPDASLLDSFTNSLTIELWLKAGQLTANADWKWLVTKGNTSWRLMGTTFANTITFSATGVSPSGDLNGSRNVNDGQWHHVAGVYDGTNMFIYVDGTLDATQPATGLITQNTYPVYLGQNAEAPRASFNGLLDEVSLYHRALSAAEIQLIYITGIGGKCPVPPSITIQPTNQTLNAGSLATLAVSATGTQPLNYQWNFNGTNIASATNSVLILAAVQPTNAGIYSVIVINPYGVVTSSNAVLTVLTQPPTIVTQPVSRTNFVGTVANFSVTAGGTFPLNYQWSVNTTNLAGATNATLVLTNVQMTQAGNYSVAVTNLYGSTNSAAAVLTVSPIPSCAPVLAGLVSWWPGEGTANDSIGANNGTLVGGATYAAGEVGKAFLFDGSSGYVSIPDSPVLDSFITRMTIETWIKVNHTTANPVWEWIVAKGNSAWRLQGTTFGNTITFSTTGISPGVDLTGNRNVNDGQWHHVAAVYDGTNKFVYVDGTLDVSGPATGAIAQNSVALRIGQNAEASGSFDGLVDELSLYNRALSAAEIKLIYVTGSGGKCNGSVPPTIVTQPLSQTNVVGTATSFSVTAGGTAPLSYQWSVNATNIFGATNATLVLTNLQLTQAGNYMVLVTNLYGSTNSAAAVLIVNPIPSCAPVLAGLVSWWTAEGTANDSISTNNGTLVGGVTYAAGEVGQAFSLNGSSSYVTIPDAPLLDSFTNSLSIETWLKVGQLTANSDWKWIVTKGNSSWRLQGTTAAKSVTFSTTGVSANVDLIGNRNVNDGQWHHVAAVYDGTNKIIYVDGTMDVSAPATGLISQNSFPVRIGENAQATASIFNGLIDEVSLYHRALSAAEIQSIYAAGSGGKCPPSAPVIFTQPTNRAAVVGSTATFTVGVGGTTPLSYLWKFNGTNLAGVNNASLSLVNVQFTNAGLYSVMVTNTYGSTLSSNAVLTVVTTPSITNQPVSQRVSIGCSAAFSISAGGTAPLSYQWWKGGSNLTGQTSATLALTNVQAADFTNYYVIVTNPYGFITSSNAVLVRNHLPVAVQNIIERLANGYVKVPVATLLANDTDADGDALAFTGVSSTSVAGGTVISSDGWVYYLPSSGYTNSDAFTYTISDGFCGGIATGYVLVQVATANGPSHNFTIHARPDGSLRLVFAGIPGWMYRIQYSSTLPPVSWADLSTNTADALGNYEFIDTPPTNAPARFYRSVSP